MCKYVAFLRGINVGGRIIKMVDLKSCLDKLGFTNVSTLLQSGNVLFQSSMESDALKIKIEKALSVKFDYPARVQVLPIDRLAAVVDSYSYDRTEQGVQHYVVFLEANLAETLISEAEGLDKAIEEAKSGKNVIYWKVQKGMTLKSAFSKYLTKPKYKEFNTVRNLNTLQKIIARSQEGKA